jgi:DNA polymerase-3 subunit epsilon
VRQPDRHPDDRTPVDGLRLLALDLETTGLSPVDDRILAVGVVPVDGTRLDLTGARRWVVDHHDPGAAVTVHGLTHDDLAGGRPLPEVLAEVREALAGRVLLAHHAPFELGFLRAAFRAVGEEPPPLPAVCTLRLQRRVLAGAGVHEPPRGALRLWQSRARFGLPAVRAHDALGDALACAELYLAQVAELGARGPVVLHDLRLRRSRGRWRWRWRRWRRARARRRAISASSR